MSPDKSELISYSARLAYPIRDGIPVMLLDEARELRPTKTASRARDVLPSFIAVIPARFASTRLPGKPLADICGKPMVVRVAEAIGSTGASRICVATDHPDVYDAVERAGIEVLMTRADHPTGTDRLAEVVSKLNLADDTILVKCSRRRAAHQPSHRARRG